MAASVRINGDLNNTEVLREAIKIKPDPAYAHRTMAIPKDEDDTSVRAKYHPFLLREAVAHNDWVARLELSTAMKVAEADMQQSCGDRLKVLMLFGSMRSRWAVPTWLLE